MTTPAAKRPKAKCPYCGHKKSVKTDGTMHKHQSNGRPCGGSGARAS